MLELPILFIKDAAGSVKRICLEEFKKVKDDSLTELLGITSLIVTMYTLRREGTYNVFHVWCTHLNNVAICPKCGAITLTIHDEKKRCIRHLSLWGKITFLHFSARRFKCQECGKVFTEELSFAEPHRRQSIAFEEQVYERCLSGTRKAVAAKECLSHSAVKEIFYRWAKSWIKLTETIRTRVLGIDEISKKKRHKQFVLIISDIERKCVLAVLPERTKANLETWIDNLSVSQRKAIRYASIDMWSPYYYAVRKKLPRAKIVVDRFHVMKQLNERISQIRRKIQRNASNEIKEVLKGSRWLLVKNRSELTEKKEERLQKILNLCPDIRIIYLLKEEFRLIFEKAKDRGRAERYLRAWKFKALNTGDNFMKKIVGTLENWWGEMLNYFFERITNGFVEGMNGAIRMIIRRAFGYRNFESFKLQVLAKHSFPTNPR
jgi:transposase